jgi:chorismate mutase
MTDPGEDQRVRDLRGQISAADRDIVAALNRRLELVRELRAYKAARGWEFVDRGREAEILAEVERANGGPLSEQGLRQFYERLLELTKRELGGAS